MGRGGGRANKFHGGADIATTTDFDVFIHRRKLHQTGDDNVLRRYRLVVRTDG